MTMATIIIQKMIMTIISRNDDDDDDNCKIFVMLFSLLSFVCHFSYNLE